MSEIYENLVDLVKFRMALEIEEEKIDKALQLSLSAFNMAPCVTYFTFDDEENIEQISDLLVTYACYILLSTNSLVERGREISISTDGTTFVPPNMSEHLVTLARELWNNWDSQVNNLKQSDSFYEDFVRE